MKNKFDEKQLYDRGKAYQYGLIAAILSISLCFLLADDEKIQISVFSTYLICIWIPIFVCFMTLILKDAYEAFGTKNGAITITILGGCGLFIFFRSFAHLVNMEETFANTIGHIFAVLCVIVITITYLAKRKANKKKYADE